jgi:hypothetical protein
MTWEACSTAASMICPEGCVHLVGYARGELAEARHLPGEDELGLRGLELGEGPGEARVRLAELGGPLLDLGLEAGVEAQDLFLGLPELGDVDAHDHPARDRTRLVEEGGDVDDGGEA